MSFQSQPSQQPDSAPPPQHELLGDTAAFNVEAALAFGIAKQNGPPYPLTVRVKHGDRWPAATLEVFLLGVPVLVIGTTEPRLKALANWISEEVS